MQDYENRGSFYLGRNYDLAARQVTPQKLLYNSSDLTTHAVCVGMTGSGKTGLCLSLIEEAALDGIPIIAIDPKGDLGNLLLAFPELAPSDFEPWIDPTVAAQKGITPAELADKTASQWRAGLTDWDQDGERIQRFNSAVDKVIYTPGSSAGIPLTVLKSFDAPSQAILDDADLFGDRVQSTTEGVLALLGIDADPVQSHEAILIASVLSHAWRDGRNLELSGLIRDLQQPPFDKVGLMDLESFMSAGDRKALGMKLNNLLAAPSFASWLAGVPLDVERLFYTAEKKPRLSILSISHLSDSERMFFVTILLNEIVSWMRAQPGTGNLRAILYMDEVFGYFPPSANPPSKKPMLTLLKQARAFGLGVVLATQNPVDLDYKGLSNAGTWFLGRLQTERDKLRVLEGLEGASAEAGSTFNRSQMEATLAALGSRVFLMNNVHANQPTVFHTRWAMSYLRGPLTRDQIRKLMEPRRKELSASSPGEIAKTEQVVERAQSAEPILFGNLQQKYWPLAEGHPKVSQLQYRPGLVAEARLHFVDAPKDIDVWRDMVVLQTIHSELPEPIWESALIFEQQAHLEDAPRTGGQFSAFPSGLSQEKNYARWGKELLDHLYRNERLVVWHCKALDANSEPLETEADFRSRLAPLAAKQCEQATAEERRAFEKKIERAEQKVRKTEQDLKTQRSQFWVRLGEFFMIALDIVLSLLGKGRHSRRQPTTSISRTMRERGEQSRAQDRLDIAQQDLEDLQEELADRLEKIEQSFSPGSLEIEKRETPLRKGDSSVGIVQLVWLPWQLEESGRATPAW